MGIVHLFVSSGRFQSRDALELFVDETYTDEGDSVASQFIDEVGLEEHEPMCVEAMWSATPVKVQQLVASASYADSWIDQVGHEGYVDAAICVYPPNLVGSPMSTSLSYLGAYNYHDEDE